MHFQRARSQALTVHISHIRSLEILPVLKCQLYFITKALWCCAPNSKDQTRENIPRLVKGILVLRNIFCMIIWWNKNSLKFVYSILYFFYKIWIPDMWPNNHLVNIMFLAPRFYFISVSIIPTHSSIRILIIGRD